MIQEEKLEVKGTTLRGHEIILNTREEKIREVCIRNNLPIVRYGEEIAITCNCGCGYTEIAKIMGVGACQSIIMACFECYMADRKDALWVSLSNTPGRITFIDPGDVNISLLS